MLPNLASGDTLVGIAPSFDSVVSTMDPSKAFLELATEYCRLIAEIENLTRFDAVAQIRKLLPCLYSKALDLPVSDIDCDDARRDVTHDEWTAVFRRLEDYLGAENEYWEIFDPTHVEQTAPVRASLADDLADIWQDLTAGLRNCDDNSTMVTPTAVWLWKTYFDAHWSQHLVDAMRTINWLCTNGPLVDPMGR